MGTTLRQIIYDIGGGILKDRPFKAVQTGGPSGGCVPEELLDLPVDYERLTEAGEVDDGLGRHDRHGRPHLHGGRGALLPRLPRGGELRQVHAVPRRPRRRST
jgi:hypothetical protein